MAPGWARSSWCREGRRDDSSSSSQSAHPCIHPSIHPPIGEWSEIAEYIGRQAGRKRARLLRLGVFNRPPQRKGAGGKERKQANEQAETLMEFASLALARSLSLSLSLYIYIHIYTHTRPSSVHPKHLELYIYVYKRAGQRAGNDVDSISTIGTAFGCQDSRPVHRKVLLIVMSSSDGIFPSFLAARWKVRRQYQ